MAEDKEITTNGHTVKFDNTHDDHMKLGTDWLRNHHSEADKLFTALKNGEASKEKGYMTFKVDRYVFRLYKSSSGGYKLKWDQDAGL